MANIIKRNTTVIYYECLVNTSICKAGTKCIAYKDDTGWKTGIKGGKTNGIYLYHRQKRL